MAKYKRYINQVYSIQGLEWLKDASFSKDDTLLFNIDIKDTSASARSQMKAKQMVVKWGLIEERIVEIFTGLFVPAGNNRDVQFNDNGLFGAKSTFFYDKDKDMLVAGASPGLEPDFSSAHAQAGSWSAIFGEEHTFLGGRATNLLVSGWHHTIGDNAIGGTFAGAQGLIAGSDHEVHGAYPTALGFGVQVEGYKAFAWGAHETNASGLVTLPRVLAKGKGSVILSYNTANQTNGHGARGEASGIFAGRDGDTGENSHNSVIIGGDRVKLPDGTVNTVALPKLRIGLGNNGALPTSGQTHGLGYNDATGEVIQIPLATTSTPGGNNREIQFNNNGSFGGSSNFVWDISDTLLINGDEILSGFLKANLLIVDGPKGTPREVAFESSGSRRWVVQANVTSESGGNAGSNFGITRYDDGGNLLGTPFTILRSNGNIGIGTTNPNHQLHSYVTTTETKYSLHVGDGFRGLSFGNSSSSVSQPTIYGRTNSPDGNALLLWGQVDGNNDSGNTEVIRIKVAKDDGNPIAQRPLLELQNATSNIITVLANGNVGINHSSPGYKLTVGGGIQAVNTSAGSTGIIRVIAAANGNSRIDFGDTDLADVGWIRYNHNNNSFEFRANSAQVATLGATGNLTINGKLTANTIKGVGLTNELTYGNKLLTVDANGELVSANAKSVADQIVYSGYNDGSGTDVFTFTNHGGYNWNNGGTGQNRLYLQGLPVTSDVIVQITPVNNKAATIFNAIVTRDANNYIDVIMEDDGGARASIPFFFTVYAKAY